MEHTVTEIIERYDRNDAELMEKVLKSTGYIRDDMLLSTVRWAKHNTVRYICAPMEADWQLVKLELMGVTNGSVTEDGDFFPLGVKTLLLNFNKRNRTVVAVNCEDVIRQHGELMGLNSGRTDDDFIAYCILLRCNYVKRPVRLGPKTVIKVMQRSLGASLDKKMHLIKYIEMCEHIRLNMDDVRRRKPSNVKIAIPNYFNKCWRAYFIFKYPPVFHADLSNSGWDNVEFETMRSVRVSDTRFMLRVGPI